MAEIEKTIETDIEVTETPKMPAYRERLKKRYADREFNSDEDWDNAAEEAFAEDEESINVFKDNNKVIDEVIASDKDLAAIIADIDERVKAQIIGGMIWNDKPVWYSIENQLNFTNATAPVTLKIGEQEDGTAIYEDFDTEEKLTAFCAACNAHKQNALTAGWAEKDGIDWAPYEALFPEDAPTPKADE